MSTTKQYISAIVKTLSDSGSGSFEALASAPTLDRDEEIIAAGAFNPLPKNVPIHVDHRHTSEGLVGTGQPYYSGDNLYVQGTFAGTARAQEVRQLIKEGHIRHMSVGFFAATRIKNAAGTPVITKAELLEVSFVTVPSNRESLILAAKGHLSLTADQARRIAMKAVVDVALSDAEHAINYADNLVNHPKSAIREADALLRQLGLLDTPKSVLAEANDLLRQLGSGR